VCVLGVTILAPCLAMIAQQQSRGGTDSIQPAKIDVHSAAVLNPQAPAADSRRLRREQLLADTARLLQLASELKAEVDKSTKDMLSIPVVKKAEEVSRLAKKVREEMKP
jgi:hypothetical protein